MASKAEERIGADEIYQRLAAPFEHTFRDVRGGVELEYITGEQVVSRLNEVLGVAGWDFTVIEHGIHSEADEIWVLAEIVARFGATAYGADQTPLITLVTRRQFGSQKVKRARSSGMPLDIGFDLKGATTDALKKCASLIGVGLYLSHKEEKQAPSEHESAARSTGQQQRRESSSAPSSAASGPLSCVVCGEELKETKFRDGAWSAQQLAGYGTRKHGKILCMAHYREANDARRRAESAEADAF